MHFVKVRLNPRFDDLQWMILLVVKISAQFFSNSGHYIAFRAEVTGRSVPSTKSQSVSGALPETIDTYTWILP